MDQVRPLDGPPGGEPPPQPPPRPRRPGRMVVIALILLGAGFAPTIGMRPRSSEPIPPPTAPQLVEAPPAEHNPDPRVVGPDAMPPPAIRITAVTTAELVRYTTSTGTLLREPRGPDSLPLLDSTGSHAAWIADSGEFRSVLHVERLDDPAPTIVYAGISPVWSARWHDFRQGRIAAVGLGVDGTPTLTVASVVLDGFPKHTMVDLSGLTTTEGGWWNIETWGDWGFALSYVAPFRDDSALLFTLDAEGALVSSLDDASVIGARPDGTLAVETGANPSAPLFLDGALEAIPGTWWSGAVERVAWLPNDSGAVVSRSGEVVVYPSSGGILVLDRWPIGWSSDGSLLAVAAMKEGSDAWELRAVDLTGRTVATIELGREPLSARIRPLVTSALALGE